VRRSRGNLSDLSGPRDGFAIEGQRGLCIRDSEEADMSCGHFVRGFMCNSFLLYLCAICLFMCDLFYLCAICLFMCDLYACAA